MLCGVRVVLRIYTLGNMVVLLFTVAGKYCSAGVYTWWQKFCFVGIWSARLGAAELHVPTKQNFFYKGKIPIFADVSWEELWLG